MSQANPISSFGNSFSTGFWSDGDWRWRWEGRRGWGTDMDHSWNSAVYPEFRGLQPYKEQKLRKRLYMPISHSSFTVCAAKLDRPWRASQINNLIKILDSICFEETDSTYFCLLTLTCWLSILKLHFSYSYKSYRMKASK